MDGVNEKGLSAAILQIHRWQAPNDGKPSISQLAVVRLLLDKAATVDEAISLLGRYDIAAYGDKYASLGGLHYALADATGAKATIEFDGGKMHVTRPTDTYQTTTNTMTWNHEIESDRRWKKVDTAVREAGGSMTNGTRSACWPPLRPTRPAPCNGPSPTTSTPRPGSSPPAAAPTRPEPSPSTESRPPPHP